MPRSVSAGAPKQSSLKRARTLRRLVYVAAFFASISGGGAERVSGVQLAAEPAEVFMNTRFAEWRAAAGARVEASLDRRGRQVASATAVADSEGVVSLAVSGGGGLPITIQPGDALILDTGGAAPERVEIPNFRAGIDAGTDVVAGQAPAGATLTISLQTDVGADVERLVTADTHGLFEHDFTGVIDIRPGAAGSVALVVEEGHVFRARIRALSALVTIGWPEFEARSTPGDGLSATVSGAGKRLAGGGPFIAGADGLGSGETFDTIDRAIITLRDPIAAGDAVTLTRRSGVLSEAEFKFIVPEVAVAMDAARRRLIGTAPAGGSIDIVLHGPDGSIHQVAGVSGSDGRFDIPAPDAPIGPGWRAEATWDGLLGLQVRAIGVVTRVTVGLHTPRVFGIARPFSDVTIMLFTAAGDRAGPWRAPIDRDGRFTTLLIGSDGVGAIAHRIGPGDVVQIDFAEGDPIPIQVPSLTARVDADSEAIEGEAPPGADLVARLEVGAPDPSIAEVAGTADAAGGYRMAFGGTIDVEPPAAGTVSLLRGDGHVIEIDWASVALQAELAGARVEGNAAPERLVSITVRDAGGAVLASAETRAITRVDDVVRWSIALTDSLGTPLRLTPGDIVSATVGDEHVEFTLPPLDGVIHVADDLVAGRTAPNTPVKITATGPTGEGGERDVVSDGTGTFAVDFAGAVDILYNDRVGLIASVDRHSVRREVRAPGVTLDLGAATISGSLEPGVTAEIDLLRDGVAVGAATARTQADATFSAQIRDSVGRPAAPLTDDRIVISAPLAGAERRIELDVPELSLTLDAGADRLSGRAASGGALDIALAHAFDEGEMEVSPEIGADGLWDAGGLGTLDIKAGSRATALLRLPSGHLARRAKVLPILNIAYGLDQVCGQADPLSAVSLRSIGSDGGENAAASVIADGTGTFAARLAGDGGRQAALTNGDTLIAVFGTEEHLVKIGAFTAELQSARSVISGTVPAGAPVTLVAPLDEADCRGRVAGPVDRPDARRTVADGAGNYAFALLGDIGTIVAQGFEVAYVGPEDHRVFRSVRGVRADVHVYQDRIEGRAVPRAEVAARLLDGSGEPTATGTAVTRADGSFSLRLRRLDGGMVTILPGDLIEIVSAILPDRVEIVRAEHLDFDLVSGGAIVGSALTGRTVDLTLKLIDGRKIEIPRVTDDDGIWGFGPADVPVRAGWNLEDVAHARARVEIGGTHSMVAEAELIDLVELGRRIFLPRVFRGWP